ncbi:YjfI family protein [Sphingomonas panni]
MDDAPRSWTTTGLADALRGAEFADELSVERIEQAEPVLKVTMHHFGDLAIFASVAGEQIIVSSLLWPVEEQADQHAFNRFLLKTQKLVPLSNFAIAEVGGREYYELVGELSVEIVAAYRADRTARAGAKCDRGGVRAAHRICRVTEFSRCRCGRIWSRWFAAPRMKPASRSSTQRR